MIDWNSIYALEILGPTLKTFFLIIFCSCLFILLVYAIMQASLVVNYVKNRQVINSTMEGPETLPMVTIQLPMYNELHVAERMIDKIVEIDYPKEKLQIQVLDDSTDETTELIRNRIQQHISRGFTIELLHRKKRKGYKAGALRDAMSQVKGEFIAIFDADFLPEPDFLKNTIPQFQDPKVGLVQTRWGHINKDYSLLTELQAFALDAHFTIEQFGRNSAGHFINFNGTAGVWRKKCIEDAGGWEDDTLTEDLDLSYRAQLKGWQFRYLEDIVSPAELPVTMAALKSQQHRWMKGGAECFKKSAFRIIRSKKARLSDKFFGLLHLFNSSVFVLILLLALCSIPLISVIGENTGLVIAAGVVSSLVTTVLIIFYWLSYSDKGRYPLLSFPVFLIKFMLFIAVSMGLSLNNSVAVIEGHLGIKSSFVRTPKFNISGKNRFSGSRYHYQKINFQLIIEGLMAILFSLFTYRLYLSGFSGMAVSFTLLSFGYLFVFIISITEIIQIRANPRYEEQPA